MKRKTIWLLLAIMTPILAMMIIQTGQAKRSTKNEKIKRDILAMKQTAALRDAVAQGRHQTDALAPTRSRTQDELARLAQKAPKTSKARLYKEMSAMGALARKVAPDVSQREDAPSKEAIRAGIERARKAAKAVANAAVQAGGPPQSPFAIGSADIVVNGPDDFGIGSTDFGFQSETAIDSNPAGTVLVAGYNDLRGLIAGFGNADGDFSVSGVARSTDGGATWEAVTTDPNLPGLIPTHAGQVFGDPDVKWSSFVNGGAGGFIYSSIFVRNSDGVEGMCINISDADGDNWSDPLLVFPTFRRGPSPGPEDDDIADKEFIDVNPSKGRILMSWTNFPGGRAEEEGDEDHDPLPHTEGSVHNSPEVPEAAIQVLVTFSDNGGRSWSKAVVVGENVADPEGGVQSSIPRFLPGTGNADSEAYVAYRVGNSDGTVNIEVNRSTNGGITWLPNGLPIDTNYPGPDQIPGNDRINNSPSLDVDYDTRRVYVTYQRNNALGQGDIALRSFIGAPVVATPLLINSNPGNDRAQWFPNISVDQDTGFVHVNFLDQDPQDSGDLTESMNTYSENQGASWSPPSPVMDRAFHAGYGNDSSEPNMGDYNENVSLGGKLNSVWGATSLQPLFNECLDGGIPVMCTPDTYYDQRLEEDEIIPLRTTDDKVMAVEGGSLTDCKNGFIDPMEIINLTIPLENYVVNPNNEPETQTNVKGRLTTTTPGVDIFPDGPIPYPDIPPGQSRKNAMPFRFGLGAHFVPGTTITFVLRVTSDQGHTQLQFHVPTGTPGTITRLISQNFNSPAAPALPPGWSSIVGGCSGMCDPWITSSARTPTQAAFHSNTGVNSMWIRLASPTVTVPTASSSGESYLLVDFDLNYSLEEDPSLLYQAFDGLFLRITRRTADGTATIRSIGAEAFAERIRTDGINFYPKHLPRSNDPNYFADMSVWSGNSLDLEPNGDGTIHVSMKFPAKGMTGNKIRLTFEYTEDSNSNCASSGGNGVCGIAVDNVLVRHVQTINAYCSSRPVGQ